jgi:hypothetical protein
VFFFSVFNALFVLIVFMLTLHKDTLHIDWPFGIKENITITEDEQVRNKTENRFSPYPRSRINLFVLFYHTFRATGVS